MFNSVISMILFPVMLAIHDVVNKTSDGGMTVEMKTYYSKYLIGYTKPLLIHDQFGQRHPIPRNGGKTIEFRKKSPFAKATTPLTEGVAPTGKQLSWSKIEATVNQYGDFVKLTDRLITEAIDENIVYGTENCADQAGRTLDTITREVLNSGTNVQYGDADVNSRYKLVGGEASGNHYLTVNAVKRAAHALKAGGAKPINGDYVAIIHPDVSYDLTADTNWIDVKKYNDPSDIYNGEIGKLHGVRFVETLEAKIFHAENLTAAARDLTVASFSTKTITVDEAITAAEAAALVGRKIIMHDDTHDELGEIASAVAGSAGSATITLKDAPANTPADGDKVYPGEAGAKGRDVYSTLFLGADAYGVTEIDGEGLQQFIKQLGSAGTADPINQLATVGWKASKTAEILVDAFLLRVETASTFASGAN